jgi:hypothetical protein
MEGKRVADPSCLSITDTTTNPVLDPLVGTVALIYNPDPSVSSQIYPAFDVVVYGSLTMDVYGMSFHLFYDSNILALGSPLGVAWAADESGDLATDFEGLTAGSVSTSLPTETVGEGVAARVIFGLTRRDPTADPPQSLVAGEWNIVARLFFTVVEEGTVDFSFSKLSLVDSDGNITGVQGLSGSITTREECL